MRTTRRTLLTAGTAAGLSSLVPAALTHAFTGRAAAADAAYRRAFAEFEAAVRPASEIFWHGYNRATAEVYAREAAARQLGATT
jgi:hypothetical protein